MNSLAILGIMLALSTAWALRAYHLDAARQRRRADRLAAECNRLRIEREDLLDELDLHVEALTAAARERHPSQAKPLRVVE